MRTLVLTGMLLLTGCGGNSFTFSGLTVWNLFPFDGDRTWRFVNVNDQTPYQIEAFTVGDPDVIRGRNVYTVAYTRLCRSLGTDCVTGEVLRHVRWSSNPSEGVFIHGYDEDGVFVDFQPPLHMSYDQMRAGDAITTKTAGGEWTSTFEGLDLCPVTFAGDWTDCGKFTVEVVGQPKGGGPIAGTYWALRGRNVVGMTLVGDFGLWELAEDDCTGDCDGDW